MSEEAEFFWQVFLLVMFVAFILMLLVRL